jgi:hypothetical protein
MYLDTFCPTIAVAWMLTRRQAQSSKPCSIQELIGPAVPYRNAHIIDQACSLNEIGRIQYSCVAASSSMRTARSLLSLRQRSIYAKLTNTPLHAIQLSVLPMRVYGTSVSPAFSTRVLRNPFSILPQVVKITRRLAPRSVTTSATEPLKRPNNGSSVSAFCRTTFPPFRSRQPHPSLITLATSTCHLLCASKLLPQRLPQSSSICTA